MNENVILITVIFADAARYITGRKKLYKINTRHRQIDLLNDL